ncbi:MAG: succinyl-diaminopimelate desuccinylase [Robiginitomaculum sp.]|nr:succinyl-diaminopimelate desuccinylase [Robiginitomaculum sp.]
MIKIDPIKLTCDLIACASVTPKDAGAMDILQQALESIGFTVTRMPFDDVDNLYARRGKFGRNFCFAGHTDVVPAGKLQDWVSPPFEPTITDGVLVGRGAADMKGGIAAFISAISEFETDTGSISLLITGDEEGDAINGTQKVLAALAAKGEKIDHCLVGEPTNPTRMGQEIKNGRRGSINTIVTVTGKQGHVAYPNRAKNPVPPLIALVNQLYARLLDDGNDDFQASNLEVTSIDVGNAAHNIIAQSATARFNIRFNTNHTGKQLQQWINNEAQIVRQNYDCDIDLDIRIMGEAFITKPGKFTTILQNAVESETGNRPALTTGGGTSDARFIRQFAEVAEFGLIGKSMHKVNEQVLVDDILTLKNIYVRVLKNYFSILKA